MAVITRHVLAEGTPVRIRGERGRYVVMDAQWSNGREVDHLYRSDNGPGHYRSVARDRLVVLRSKRKGAR